MVVMGNRLNLRIYDSFQEKNAFTYIIASLLHSHHYKIGRKIRIFSLAWLNNILVIKGPLACLVSVKKRLKYTLLNSYYKSKCFARPQKACMLFTLAIFTGSSLKTFAPLKK